MTYFSDESEPLVGSCWQGKYTVFFNRYIYDSYKDGVEMSGLVPKVLSPEKFEDLGGFEDMSGYFIKDGIKVEMYWDSMVDYYWQADTDKEETVFAWAALVQKEYLYRSEKSGKAKPLIAGGVLEYTVEFDKYAHDCIGDCMLFCEATGQLLSPEDFSLSPDTENICGYFIKDGIRVEMHGTRVRLYDDEYRWSVYWQADTDRDRIEERIILELAEHIRNEYPKIKENGMGAGEKWSFNRSKTVKEYRAVIGFNDIEGRFNVSLENYNREIYNDRRDGLEYDKIIRSILCPDEIFFEGEKEMKGYFVKDGVRVDTYWSWERGYIWGIDRYDEDIKKKAVEWGRVVQREHLREYIKVTGKKYQEVFL